MTLKTPSVLAFERKLDISDATFWQTNGKDKMPVLVQEKSVRGTISNRLKNAIASDPAKLDSEIQKANLQTVDASFLDESCDTLITRFTVKVLPFDGKANVCNEQAYQNALLDVVQAYKDEHGFDELARRYAYNIANARFLWRNRMGAESVSVVVTLGDESVKFANARELSLNNFDYQDDKLARLASWIKGGLMGDKFTILTVEAYAKVGFGQEVYPSQELILDTGSKKRRCFIVWATRAKTVLVCTHKRSVTPFVRLMIGIQMPSFLWRPSLMERLPPLARHFVSPKKSRTFIACLTVGLKTAKSQATTSNTTSWAY